MAIQFTDVPVDGLVPLICKIVVCIDWIAPTHKVPTGTDVSQLVKKQKLLNNSVGPKRIKSKYYLDGHMVGYGMQYEKEILSDLLLNASF